MHGERARCDRPATGAPAIPEGGGKLPGRRLRGPIPPPPPPPSSYIYIFVYLSYHTTHTTKAERRGEKHRQRRCASSGQNTKRGIEGEDPAAAGIQRRFLSLKGPREERSSRRDYRQSVILYFSTTETKQNTHTESHTRRMRGGLYKILFHVESCLWESIILSLTPPPAKPTLLQYLCTAIARYTIPSPDPPVCMPYAIQYC